MLCENQNQWFSQKKFKKKKIAQHLVSSTFGRPLVFEKFFTMLLYFSNTYLYLHHMCFILNDLKSYGSATSSSYSSLKCKGKGVMKKYQENKLYNLQNMFFCFSLSLDPSYFQTL